MPRKAQCPSVASGSTLRLLLAKADLMAEAGNGACLSSSAMLCRPHLALEGSALQVDISLHSSTP